MPAPVTGDICAIDPGSRSGYAIGPPGGLPEIMAVRLRKTREHRGVVMANMMAFLQAQWSARRPELVVIEQPMSLQAYMAIGDSGKTARFGYEIVGVIEGMASRWGIRQTEVAVNTARKHFIGVADLGDRDETKAAVIRRAIQLGYLARGCDDTEKGDAVCIWDWATAEFGRKAAALHLYEQGKGR